MVKHLVDIEPVCPLRRRCHAKKQARLKIVDDFLIRRRARAVHLVNNDRVESMRIKRPQGLISRHCLHGRENVIRIGILPVPGQNSIGDTAPEHTPEAFHRLRVNLLSVHQKKHALLVKLAHRKGCRICLAGSCRGNEKRLSFPGLLQLLQRIDKLKLHGIRLEPVSGKAHNILAGCDLMLPEDLLLLQADELCLFILSAIYLNKIFVPHRLRRVPEHLKFTQDIGDDLAVLKAHKLRVPLFIGRDRRLRHI